jgi:hypothetical protein
MTVNIFEQATKQRLRWDFRGQCTVEDLWNLSLEDLDFIYKDLRRNQRDVEEDSLLGEESGFAGSIREVLKVKIDVVKYIVEIRLKERNAAKNTQIRAQKRARLLEILADKEHEELRDKSVEELKELIDELT